VEDLHGNCALMARRSARASGDQTTAIARERLPRSRAQPELAQDLFVRDALTAGERSTGPDQGRCCFRRDLFLFLRSLGQRARQRFHHHFEQAPHGVHLRGRQQIQQRMGLLAFLIEIRSMVFPLTPIRSHHTQNHPWMHKDLEVNREPNHPLPQIPLTPDAPGARSSAGCRASLRSSPWVGLWRPDGPTDRFPPRRKPVSLNCAIFLRASHGWKHYGVYASTRAMHLSGIACHVTQRGVDRRETFSSDADRETYLSLIRQNLKDAGVALLAWV